MKKVFYEFKENKKKKTLKMIQNIVTLDSLTRGWSKIATKMADQLKQKYYAYYIKEHYAKEIK